ncbi:MAG: thioredoxin domain-containing protein [Desulfuromonadales bacterium]|nr:thioredoxin domain-containing protein [Desulfuromonadales bacterium]
MIHGSGAHVAHLMSIDKSTLPSDGGEQFNRLIFARSPYLLQHAQNPVKWYEWCDEAFEKARHENLPLLLSIGYATCHWCHVMAHESFEDHEVAALLNRNYVCIKVDREERPDIDDFYMTVSQILTGSGGWPLNIFMTPDRRPFFAMTYLPKHGRGSMGGFMDLLKRISALWQQHPRDVEKTCGAIMGALEQHSHNESRECTELVELEALTSLALNQLSGIYDQKRGGFGSAPKFPLPITLSWLAEQGSSGTPKALDMAQHTLRMMRRGGIWDQIGGGMHRYSVDNKWLVPHFEKMLYDQAMIALATMDVYQAGNDPFFLGVVDNIFRFVSRELTSPNGTFYSALDADLEGKEGTYYLWKRDEIEEILDEDMDLFCRFFDVSEKGNFEEKNILNVPVDITTFCAREKLNQEETEHLLDKCCKRLLEQREERIYPLRDEKIITAWNGLMIAALARGGSLSGEAEYIESASRAAHFILKDLKRADGRLVRSFLDEPSDVLAFLEDYAFFCSGLIELFEATLDTFWQGQALLLADEILRLFRDPNSGGFVKIGHDAEQMPARAALDYDGVVPSPFSQTAKCFISLGYSCDRPDLLDHAHILVHSQLESARQNPTMHLGSIQALAMLESDPVIIQFQGQRDSLLMASLLRSARSVSISNLVIRFTESSHSGQAFVCAQGTCYPPVSSGDSLCKLLASLQKSV